MVQVEVVAGDGTPMAGVDLANFSFQVGAQAVPAANILTSATIMGQQWFVLRAPTQASAAKYNLTVSYSTALSDTEVNAVDYTPRLDSDNVITIDRSGSMGDFGKMDAAKASARLFVDSWRAGDSLGIVSFNNAVTTDMALTAWSDPTRTTAFSIINAFTPVGGTRIGDAIRAAWDQLVASGDNTHNWAIILISDGLETDPGNETFDQVIQALDDATGKVPSVFTVAIGPDADRIRMQNAAARTGGTYQYVSAPASPSRLMTPDGVMDIANMGLRMDYRYRAIATDIAGQQPFYAAVGPLSDPDPYNDVLTITVESGAAEIFLSLSWDPLTGYMNTQNTYLTDPNSAFVAPFEMDTRHMVWRVSGPLAGNWLLHIAAFQPPPSGAPAAPDEGSLAQYLVQASVKSEVTMDVFIAEPPAERTTGAPLHLLASLTDVAPITGAAVLGGIETPSGLFYYLWFFDDGLHNDGAASDGLYGATFYQTGEDGSYNASILGWGSSAYLGSNFVRLKVISFHMDGGGDQDLDLLPTHWELRFRLNPDDPGDSTGDPDSDGLPNNDEWGRGTDPRDNDSDDGGESDGTDPNPLDPSDDTQIPLPWGRAYPGVGKVVIRHVIDPSYAYTALLRGDNPLGPFTLIDYDFTGQDVYTDTTVSDGSEYCYILAAVVYVDPSYHASAFTAPTCATPNTDPWPPRGAVTINDGASSTHDPNVTLALWATDTIDPELRPSETEFLPPADSSTNVTDMLICNNLAWQMASGPVSESLPLDAERQRWPGDRVRAPATSTATVGDGGRHHLGGRRAHAADLPAAHRAALNILTPNPLLGTVRSQGKPHPPKGGAGKERSPSPAGGGRAGGWGSQPDRPRRRLETDACSCQTRTAGFLRVATGFIRWRASPSSGAQW
jgi:Mg-chelatase subunit ChlD